MLKASQGPPPGHHLVQMRPGGAPGGPPPLTYAPAHGYAPLPHGAAPTASNFTVFAPSAVMSVPVQPTGVAAAARVSPIAVLPGQYVPPRAYSQEPLPPAEAVPGPWFQAQPSLPQHYQQYNPTFPQLAFAPQGNLLAAPPTSPPALVTPGRTPGRSPPPPPRQAYAAAAPAPLSGPLAPALLPPGTARSSPPTAAAAYVAPAVVFGSSSAALGSSSSPPGARASARVHVVPPLRTAVFAEGGDGGGSLVLSARSGGALSPGSGVNSGSRGSPSQARLGGFESPAPVGAAAVPSGLGDRDRSKRDSPGHGAAARTRRRVAGAPDEPLSPPSARAADLDLSGRRLYLQGSDDGSEASGSGGRRPF